MSNLPANVLDLAKGLTQSAASTGSGPTGDFMKFAKGDWSYGAEETEVEEGSEWAIHPEGFMHGWIGWGDKAHDTESQKLGEVMFPAAQALPRKTELDDIQGSWSQQVAMQMLCVSEGGDAGTTVVFNTSSAGGKKAYQKVLMEIVKKIQSGDEAIVPVVVLSTESYKHKTYGKIYNPILSVVDWMTLGEAASLSTSTTPDESDGMIGQEDETPEVEAAVEVEEAVETEPEVAPSRPRRAPEAEAEAPEAEAEAPARRRRRR